VEDNGASLSSANSASTDIVGDDVEEEHIIHNSVASPAAAGGSSNNSRAQDDANGATCQVEDLEESNDVVDTPNAVADANMHVLQTGDDSPPSILCNTAAAARGAENAQSRQQNVNIRHDDRSPNSIRLRYSRNAGPTSSVESVGRLIGEHPLHPDFVVR
jgi:hypothetical protein